MEQPAYTVAEEAGHTEICVVLEGMLKAEIIISFLTEDESAAGMILFFGVFSLKYEL